MENGDIIERGRIETFTLDRLEERFMHDVQLQDKPVDRPEGALEVVLSALRTSVAFALFVVIGSSVIVAGFVGRRKTWGQWLTVRFCRWALAIVGVRVVVIGANRIPTTGGFVLAANHQSHLDGIALLAMLPRFLCVLGKRELFSKPILGRGFRAMGFVPVDRGDRRRSEGVLDSTSEMLRSGMALMVFPEGTRSVDGVVLPFKTGAVRMAARADVPVLPVGIVGTYGRMPTGSWRVLPGTFCLVVV